MSPAHLLTILCAMLTGILAGTIPSNVIGINNIIDFPNKLSGIAGFGSKGNNTNEGSTTIMGSHYGSIIPNIPQIFGANKTGSSNDTNSGFGTDFGSIISGFPNKVIGQNKTDIGSIVSSFPDKIFGNNKTSENGIGSGIPDLGSVTNILGNKNQTSSGNCNKTSSGGDSEAGHGSSGDGWIPEFGSVIPSNILGNNKPCCIGGPNITSESQSNVIPDFGSIIPGFPSHSKNGTNTGYGSFIPTVPNFGSIASEIPNKLTGNEHSDHKPRERRCHHCKHQSSHGSENDDPNTEHSRSKRQASNILGSLTSGGSNLGSLGSGASTLGSLGSSLGSGEATLIMGMFQVLVKPIKGLPGAEGITDLIKNPQNILTQPQTLLSGGK